MTLPLLAAIAGLAALDSLNPATLVAVSLILLGSRDRPVAEAAGVVVGAFASVLTVGLIVYLGADAAASAVDGALAWVRRGAFALASLVLLVSAVRALRPRHRSAVGLPAWFTPPTAVVLGVVMTGADLPNAFPFFIALERLVVADTSTPVAVAVLVAYAAIYCIPCLVLLAIGLSHAGPVQGLLRLVHDAFGTETDLPANRWKAAGLLILSLVLAGVAASV
ncbi:GAP family protein [Nocardioides sp.]|uniref:GAP family protein n=1 Tax=Nocardioides sp. TaxID=35761 RepID=UPI002C8FB905|nr:GAP family protein [Nocardioides sp.]HXH80979.1 GAP family protein [Nocardioides sp.]